jgi:hypothetical protein
MHPPETVPAALRFGGQVWAPTTFPKPLSEAYVSDGPRFIRLVHNRWRMEDGSLIVLDLWQQALLCALLERFPEDWPTARLRGRLRWRQAVVSMGRQSGKSIIGGVLALYGLTQHTSAPKVIGVASSLDQARIIYNRARFAVKSDPGLQKMLKGSGTRGIVKRDGSGGYDVKPSGDDGLQGVPITLGVFDELHLSKEAMYDSLVTAQRAQLDPLLIGLTTAGDTNSTLLKRLYTEGENAISDNDPDGRFGFWLWTAPATATLDTPGAIEAANPAIACGRIDVDVVRADEKNKPEPDWRRYTLNQMVASVSTWMPAGLWNACANGGIPQGDHSGLVWTVTKTANWEHACITLSLKQGDKVFTEVVASIANPSLEQLDATCRALFDRHGGVFVVPSRTLSTLGKLLRDSGYEVYILADTEMQQACSMAYSKISNGLLSHPSNDLLNAQMPIAKRRNVGEGWTLAGTENPLGIDSIQGLVMGLYVAERHPAAASMI